MPVEVHSTEGLGTDSLQSLWWNMVEPIQDIWHKRRQVLHSVAHGLDHEYSNRESCEVLLELEVAVHCQEHLKPSGSERKQLPILDAGPPAALHCRSLVAREQCTKMARQILVKQDAHLG